MNLSIIIPSFNTKALLLRCLKSIDESLSGSSLSSEIIVVDNGSTDGSRELVESGKWKVESEAKSILIENKKNVGYGKANNQGINAAKGEIILLLNSDIKVINNAIEQMYQFVKEHPKSFAGGKLLNEDGSPQASCGPFYTLPVVFFMLFAKGDALGLTRYSPDRVRAVDWVSGACLAGYKKGFLDNGLFDEQIFMYMEEIELLYRARKKGYTTLFTPRAPFIHTGAASSGSKKEPVLNIYRGLIYFYTRHRSIIELGCLKLLLRLKAVCALVVGKLTSNRYLTSTYEQALRLS